MSVEKNSFYHVFWKNTRTEFDPNSARVFFRKKVWFSACFFYHYVSKLNFFSKFPLNVTVSHSHMSFCGNHFFGWPLRVLIAPPAKPFFRIIKTFSWTIVKNMFFAPLLPALGDLNFVTTRRLSLLNFAPRNTPKTNHFFKSKTEKSDCHSFCP